MNWREFLGWNDDNLNDLQNLGFLYVKEGIYDTALTFFEALSVLQPLDAYNLQMLGAIHLQKGNGLQALETIDEALKLDPASLKTMLNRAKALFMLGYRKQGLLHAFELEKCEDPSIASQAEALILAYK